MIWAVAIVIAAVLLTSVVGAIIAALAVHTLLLERVPGALTEPGAVVAGLALTFGLVFVMMWQINPDPPRPGAPPTRGGTAALTAFAALGWVPVFAITYRAIRKRKMP